MLKLYNFPSVSERIILSDGELEELSTDRNLWLLSKHGIYKQRCIHIQFPLKLPEIKLSKEQSLTQSVLHTDIYIKPHICNDLVITSLCQIIMLERILQIHTHEHPSNANTFLNLKQKLIDPQK